MSALSARRHAVGRAFAMIRERPLAFLLAVLLSASALALPLTIASLGWAARPVIGQVQPAPEISVFVAPRATAREVDALKQRLERMGGVSQVELRPKDAALAQLARRAGFEGAPADLGANPLPDVLIARLPASASADVIEARAAEVRSWAMVDGVRTDLDWYRKLKGFARLGITATVLFGSLVALLVALILVGTVRLHAGTRADEVALLTLVGATRRFISRPYAYSAALTLLLAAAVAAGVVYGAHAALRVPVANLAALYGSPFVLPDPEPLHLVAVLLVAVVAGWLVGLLGVRSAIAAR